MAKRTRTKPVDVRKEYPPDYLNLVVDMYIHNNSFADTIEILNRIYPNLKPLTVSTIKKILTIKKGDVINERAIDGVSMVFVLDRDVAEFIRSLPYNSSNFVNAVLGIYIREYKLKKAQQEAEENSRGVTRFG